jgi:L-malate glycosyltransferase
LDTAPDNSTNSVEIACVDAATNSTAFKMMEDAHAIGTGFPRRIGLVAAGPDILGGQSRQAELLAERLRGEGCHVDFIAVNRLFPRGLRWLRKFRYLRTIINEFLYVPVLFRLWRADVVHVFSASYWSFLLAPVPAMLVARLLGKRVVLHYHSGEAEDHLQHWGMLVHPWLRLADIIVVPSRFLHDVFAQFGHQTRVIRNMLDSARFHYRERTDLQPHLLSMRNLEPHYSIQTIVEAFGLLKLHFPEATLTIAGSGSEEARLRWLVGQLRLNGVRFVGRTEPVSLPKLLDEADIFVNASTVDNQPVSILEAFAAGLPVVSTPTGDIRAMLDHGRAGKLVGASDPRAIVEAVTSLLEQPILAVQMVRHAAAELGRYNWNCVRGRWAEIYQEVRA